MFINNSLHPQPGYRQVSTLWQTSRLSCWNHAWDLDQSETLKQPSGMHKELLLATYWCWNVNKRYLEKAYIFICTMQLSLADTYHSYVNDMLPKGHVLSTCAVKKIPDIWSMCFDNHVFCLCIYILSFIKKVKLILLAPWLVWRSFINTRLIN